MKLPVLGLAMLEVCSFDAPFKDKLGFPHGANKNGRYICFYFRIHPLFIHNLNLPTSGIAFDKFTQKLTRLWSKFIFFTNDFSRAEIIVLTNIYVPKTR